MQEFGGGAGPGAVQDVGNGAELGAMQEVGNCAILFVMSERIDHTSGAIRCVMT